MGVWIKIGAIYLLIINIVGFACMGIDKKKAQKHAWRIPEKTLFLLAIIGGSLGSLIGMQCFRHKTKHTKFVIGIPAILVIQVILIALLCNLRWNHKTMRTDFAMGTVVQTVVYGADSERIGAEIAQELVELDTNQLSWREDGSSVAGWNRRLQVGTECTLAEEEFRWMQTTLDLCEKSNGAFDITIHPVIELWGIESDEPRVPTEEEITQALTQVGYERLHIRDNKTMFGDTDTVSVDLGAVGKGIAADHVRTYLDSQKISGAVVSIGGTILVYGYKPGTQGWNVGIQNPRDVQGVAFGTLTIEESCVVSTSGDYEQYFVEDDIWYHHIFDPKTGYPAESGLCSVTVVCNDGILSDGLSTACFVLGYEKSLPLLEQYDAEGIFVTKDMQVYVTDGIRDNFEITSSDYSMGN